MCKNDIEQILIILINSIKNYNFQWRLEWSANLKIQWLNISVNDLDITTTLEGLDIFEQNLKQFVIKKFYNDKIHANSLILNINWFELEINAYEDRTLNMFDKIEFYNWKWINIPILPLIYAKKFYKQIGRSKKVKIIHDFLKRNIKK